MQWLFTLVDLQLGHGLFKEIERSKIEISNFNESIFNYKNCGIEISEFISRDQFEDYSYGPISKIKAVMEKTILRAKVDPLAIDIVCVTGGTGLLPSVIKMLEDTFGKQKLKKHNHFKSVIDGLGRHALKIFF